MFNLMNPFRKSSNYTPDNVANAVNDALGIDAGSSGDGVDELNGQSSAITGDDSKLIPANQNAAVKSNSDNCSHWLMKYPPLIGKIKTCLKCGILLAPGGIQGGENTVRISGNHIEMSTATAPANPASGLVRMYATSATSVRMRDSAGTETDLAGAGAVTRAGSNTTEATTTSTTSMSLMTVSALSIAVGTPMQIRAVSRKTTGGPYQGAMGVMLNTTEVKAPATWTDNVDQADHGRYLCDFVYGVTNYLRAGVLFLSRQFSAVDQAFPFLVDSPTATLTDVIIRASVTNAAITAAADEMHVYTYAVS